LGLSGPHGLLNSQLTLGQPIDLSQHAQAVSTMVRVASRLGLQRRAGRACTATQAQLLMCRELDGRISVAKAFDRLGFLVGNPLAKLSCPRGFAFIGGA